MPVMTMPRVRTESTSMAVAMLVRLGLAVAAQSLCSCTALQLCQVVKEEAKKPRVTWLVRGRGTRCSQLCTRLVELKKSESVDGGAGPAGAEAMALNGALNLWGQGTDALAVRVAVRVRALAAGALVICSLQRRPLTSSPVAPHPSPQARPMSVREKMEEAQECVLAVDNTQLRLGSKHFTFDAVYGGNSRQESIYDDCVRELVAGCFGGYNATVLAYGQTGSGKTHTMGSSSVDTVLLEDQGIIPRAVRQMFDEIHQRTTSQPGWSCKVFVSFLEIYNEEFKDLLDTQPLVGAKGKNNIALREGPNGSIQVVGASEESVSSYDDMLQCLEKGTVCRSVGSTSMNAVSSRSHAIFTVTIEQTTVDAGKECLEHMDPNTDGADGDGAPLERSTSVMTSKFHFVDLAGSERAKKTGAEGGRLKEGININYGLLVLGNVISALGDEARKGSHVPYRDSKLTRMLQDSIGGNSRTLMIACISPADCNFAESYNTITYANRARNIKNKPVVNRDARDAKMAAMLEQIQRLKAERDCALKRAGAYASGTRCLACRGLPRPLLWLGCGGGDATFASRMLLSSRAAWGGAGRGQLSIT